MTFVTHSQQKNHVKHTMFKSRSNVKRALLMIISIYINNTTTKNSKFNDTQLIRLLSNSFEFFITIRRIQKRWNNEITHGYGN